MVYRNIDRAYINVRFDRLEAMLIELGATLIAKEEEQMVSIQDVQNEVAEQTTVIEGVVTLLDGLSQQLRDAIAQGDPAAIEAVVAAIDANTNKLSEAVARNTAAADEPHAGGM